MQIPLPFRCVGLLVAFFLAVPSVLFAAAPSNEELMKKINALEVEVSTLKQQLAAQPAPTTEMGAEMAAEAEKAAEAPGPFSKAKEFFSKAEVHGYGEAGYIANLTGDNGNALHVFDVGHHDFFGEAELSLLKNLDEIWDAGFRFDLRGGSDIPEVITATGSGDRDDIDIEQAMITLRAPFFDKSVDIAVGKFVTHMGWEYIQGWDAINDNITRGILFGFAIPFTHTGIKATYDINDNATFTLLGFNGWDNFDDNNEGKSVGSQLVLKINDQTTVYANGIVGPEQDDENSDWRYLAELILEFAPNDIWTFVVDGVYGHEDDVDFVTTVPAIVATTVGGVTALDAAAVDIINEDDADWGGLAGYVRCQLNDVWAVIARGEYFNDDEGARTGTEQEVWEVTGTLEAKLTDNFRLRGEARYDDSDEDVFDGGDDDHQVVVGFNGEYIF